MQVLRRRIRSAIIVRPSNDNVLPLFTEDGVWFDGAQACTGCHFANSENSYHEMDLSSYAGIMSGGDVLSEPPGVPLLGQSEVGATDYDWEHAKLKERLRNNRMPAWLGSSTSPRKIVMDPW